MKTEEIMAEIFEKYNIPVDSSIFAKLVLYMDLLLEWNEKVNLTAITDKRQIILKHFADSLILMKYIGEKNIKIIDVGTGAGFPGLPLKIACGEMSLTLMDSLNKRIKFLDEVVGRLELEGVCTVHSRAEDGAKGELRQGFDISLSRAVARLNTLSEYCMPYVKKNGLFVAYKGYDVDDELKEAENAIKLLGGEIEDVKKFVFEDEFSRSLIFIRKKRDTPPKYPRNSGIIIKKPIL